MENLHCAPPERGVWTYHSSIDIEGFLSPSLFGRLILIQSLDLAPERGIYYGSMGMEETTLPPARDLYRTGLPSPQDLYQGILPPSLSAQLIVQLIVRLILPSRGHWTYRMSAQD